jgi:methyl-accepting chemotaxis protein
MKHFRDWSIAAKLIAVVGVGLVVIALAAGAYVYQQRVGQARAQAEHMAQALSVQIEADRRYYAKHVVERLLRDGAVTRTSESFHREKNTIPLPATFLREVTDEINREGHHQADLLSLWPINKAKAPRNSFEREALEQLAKDRQQSRTAVVTEGNETNLYHVVADIATEPSCVQCHNQHPNSPKRDFKLGDVMGALVLRVPMTREVAAARQDAGAIIAGITVAFLVFLVVLSWLVRRLVGRPIQTLVRNLEQVAEGDLTVSVGAASQSEVGRANRATGLMVQKLTALLRHARSSADRVAAASEQLASASEGLSAASQEQAAALEETAASLEEITSSVKQNADNAQQASQLAAGSRGTAEQGGQVVRGAVAAMAEISQSSRKITDIIGAIDEIAFQTNLLALNAAVESARAGEQGRGFAVVAAEVRGLAQRSAAAAKEIKALISDSVRKVEAGGALVDKSGQSLEEIVAWVRRVTDLMTEIAASAREQSGGIEQVNRAVAQMDSVVQRNAAQTEELTSTAQALAGQAEKLRSLIEQFKLGEEGPTSPATQTDAPRLAAAQGRRVTTARHRPSRDVAPTVAAGGAENTWSGQGVGPLSEALPRKGSGQGGFVEF